MELCFKVTVWYNSWLLVTNFYPYLSFAAAGFSDLQKLSQLENFPSSFYRNRGGTTFGKDKSCDSCHILQFLSKITKCNALFEIWNYTGVRLIKSFD